MHQDYYVNDNQQNTGEHEVHNENCTYLSQIVSKTYLGYFDNCDDAVTKAKQHYSDVDGCFHCCEPCHTR